MTATTGTVGTTEPTGLLACLLRTIGFYDVGFDDVGSSSCCSALEGSLVTSKSDTEEADSGTKCAGVPAIWWRHILIVASMPHFPSQSHSLVPFPFIYTCTLVALGTLSVHINYRWLQDTWVYVIFLEYNFHVIFVAFFLPLRTPGNIREFSEDDLPD